MPSRTRRAPFCMTLHLEGEVRKKGKWHIASCPVFDLFTQGESKEKAVKNMNEALREFLLSCFERGTIDEVLKTAGLMPVSEYLPGAPQPAVRNHRIDLRVELPLVWQFRETAPIARTNG